MEKVSAISQPEVQAKPVKPVKEVERTDAIRDPSKTNADLKDSAQGNDALGQSSDRKMSQETMKQALSDANSKMKDKATACEFGYNDKLDRVTIKVVDKETRETVREVPAEKTLEMIEKIWELAGLLVDEKL